MFQLPGTIGTGIEWEVLCTFVKKTEEMFKVGHDKFSIGKILVQQAII